MSEEKKPENKVIAQLKQTQAKLDGMTVRERGILLLAAIAVIYAMFELMILKPMDERTTYVKSKGSQFDQQIAEITEEMGKLSAEREFDPDADEKKRIAHIHEDIAVVDAQLQEKMGGVVSPSKMTGLIRDVLTQNDALVLKRLETLPTESLSMQENEEAGAPAAGAAKSDIYKHTVRLEFEGEYLTVLQYLQALEKLSESFYWKNLALKTTRYPTTRVSLEIYTLSTRKGWVGV